MEAVPTMTPTDRSAPTAPTVLVADDDGDLLALSTTVLRRAGYDVTAARSGTDALEAAGRMTGPDVLFTDIVMPGLDGFGLAEALHRDTPDLAVVYTTGRADADVRERAAELGCELLRKPYTPDELLRAIAAVSPAPGVQPR